MRLLIFTVQLMQSSSSRPWQGRGRYHRENGALHNGMLLDPFRNDPASSIVEGGGLGWDGPLTWCCNDIISGVWAPGLVQSYLMHCSFPESSKIRCCTRKEMGTLEKPPSAGENSTFI